MNLTPWNNNSIQRSSGSNTAESLQAAAKRTEIVSTAKPIEGFRQISKSEVDSYKEEVKKHKEFVRNFNKYCELNLEHQELDGEATGSLVKWRLGTTRLLARKQLMIERQIAGQRKIAKQFVSAREKIHNPPQKDDRQQATDYARDTLWS